jgi:prepilin-type N-terminal cleavage/methylation domain-containing protein
MKKKTHSTKNLTHKSIIRIGPRGFTLIEVLISLLILAGASLVLYQSWSGSLSAIRKARVYNTVALLLQKKVVEFETKNQGKRVEDIADDEHGDFGSDYPDYKWEIKSRPFAVPPIVPPRADGETQNELTVTILKTMSEYFEKAVREVSVTVSYTRGANTQKYSVSTIFVDYTKELPL